MPLLVCGAYVVVVVVLVWVVNVVVVFEVVVVVLVVVANAVVVHLCLWLRLGMRERACGACWWSCCRFLPCSVRFLITVAVLQALLVHPRNL